MCWRWQREIGGGCGALAPPCATMLSLAAMKDLRSRAPFALSILALLLCCACGSDGSEDNSKDTAGAADLSAATSGTLSALSYNVYGLPSFITGGDTGARMTQIGPLLNAFDVVGLQEDFIDDNHAELAAGCTLTTRTRFAEPLAGKGYGSGLATFATLPLVAHEGRHYSTCNGILDHGSDCMASKGILYNRFQLAEGMELDFYTTHLDAGGSEDDATARAVQVGEALAFIKEHSEGRAVIWLGDFNLRPSDPPDKPQLERIVAETGMETACDALKCAEPDHIDRVYFRSGDVVKLKATAWQVEPQFIDVEGEPLSDHPAISARFSWSR